MIQNKLLSIITVNLNNIIGLQRTIKSVLGQSYSDVEFIIIDGGSNDGSKEYLQKNAHLFAYWHSETDTGIYNAMNKGLQISNSKYVMFLNSGDQLAEDGILSKISQIILTNKCIDFFYSDVINISSNKIHYYPKVLTFKYFYEYTINHQATIFKKDLFLNFGFYNESYKIVSDWEFYLKILFLYRCSYKYIDVPLIQFDYDFGLSTSKHGAEIIKKERLNVLNSLFPHFISDYDYFRSITKSKTWQLIIKLNKFRSIFGL